MKIVTIDASAAASWLLPRQRTPAADAFITAEEERHFIAPDVFAWEIGNLIVRNTRREVVVAAECLDDLRALNIEVMAPRTSEDVLALVDFAGTRSLSLFDSAYLLLCLERGAALASRDDRLLEAARAAGVDVFDLRD